MKKYCILIASFFMLTTGMNAFAVSTHPLQMEGQTTVGYLFTNKTFSPVSANVVFTDGQTESVDISAATNSGTPGISSRSIAKNQTVQSVTYNVKSRTINCPNELEPTGGKIMGEKFIAWLNKNTQCHYWVYKDVNK